MYDCAEDVLGYHDDEVTLPDAERKTMRERRGRAWPVPSHSSSPGNSSVTTPAGQPWPFAPW